MVLKDGRIVEWGSHRELLELNGLFASMWADQISASEDPEAQTG
jgi:ATP-binding cassette subfamily B (MDR/TAP) protein 6